MEQNTMLDWVKAYMTVEDVVGCVLVEFEVPDQNHPIWVHTSGLLKVVGGGQNSRVLQEKEQCSKINVTIFNY